VSYNQLGSIYLIQKEYIKALDAFQKASSIMEFNSGYRTIEPDQEQVLLSDVYLKMADIYRILEQKDLICAYYQKAISAIENEMRPDKTEVKNILKEQIIIYCNE
jgi:tetratricopeptide (TPR) repeat protein